MLLIHMTLLVNVPTAHHVILERKNKTITAGIAILLIFHAKPAAEPVVITPAIDMMNMMMRQNTPIIVLIILIMIIAILFLVVLAKLKALS